MREIVDRYASSPQNVTVANMQQADNDRAMETIARERFGGWLQFAPILLVYMIFARLGYVASLPGPWPANASALLFRFSDDIWRQSPLTIGLVLLFCRTHWWRSPWIGASTLWSRVRERRAGLPVTLACATIAFFCFLAPYYVWLMLLYFLLSWAAALMFIARKRGIFAVLIMAALLGLASQIFAERWIIDFRCRPGATLTLLSGETIACSTIYPLDDHMLVETATSVRVLRMDDVSDTAIQNAIGPASILLYPPVHAP